MKLVAYSIFSKPNPDIFFNREGLNERELQRLDGVVSSSKVNLSIADRLQEARNNLRSDIALEVGLNRNFKDLGIRFSLIDITI